MARFGGWQAVLAGVVGAALAGCAQPEAVVGPPPGLAALPPGTSVITLYDPNTNQPVRSYVTAPRPRAAAPAPEFVAPPAIVPPSVVAPGKSASAARRPRSSGTGFYVSPRDVVTNAHVVAGCAELRDERGGRFTVVAADPGRDLALLRPPASGGTFLRFSAGGTELGENVVVLGYPYAGSPLSTGLNLTAGIVSANAGPGGSTRHFQITAPVQPGNSGGPVLDGSGGVVGVVRARASDVAVLAATGALPQNINFAIRGDAVEAFLRENGVTPAQVAGERNLSARAISAGASDAVVSVRCLG